MGLQNAETAEGEKRGRKARRWFGWIGLVLVIIAIIMLVSSRWDNIQRNMHKSTADQTAVTYITNV
ncbi:MAG: hypothetical protein PHY34_04570 [Patescibacteria group bacterium]|nr:hypothetical protein [Patescibacteria group bacterium]